MIKDSLDMSFDERCELVRRTRITSDMSYDERFLHQLVRYGFN